MAGKGQFSVSTPRNLKRYQELRDEGYTIKEASEAMGLTFRQGRYLSEQLKQASPDEINQAPAPHKSIDDSGVVSSDRVDEIRNGQDLSDEQLLKLHGLDPSKFEITSVTSNFWGEGANGEPLYQTKIKASPKAFKLDDVVDAINDRVVPLNANIPVFGDDSQTSLIIPLFDLHFGINTLEHVKPFMNEILDLIKAKPYENIILVLGGDYFHSDFMHKTQTASNTQLDHVDNMQSLNDGTSFISSLISAAYHQSMNVSVYTIRGNHDDDKLLTWSYGMRRVYYDTPVDWNLTLSTRDYFAFDDVGVMISHGDKPRQRKLPALFATESPKIWANSTYRLILTGHFHSEKVDDDSGVVMMQVPTSKPSDNYEDDNGFTMSRQKMIVLEFNQSRLLCTHYIEPDPTDPESQMSQLLSYD